MRIRQSLLQPYIPWTGMHAPWKVQRLGAGVNGYYRAIPRVRVAVDCRQTDQGDVREETGGKCLWRKASSHGSKVILLSHM